MDEKKESEARRAQAEHDLAKRRQLVLSQKQLVSEKRQRWRENLERGRSVRGKELRKEEHERRQ